MGSARSIAHGLMSVKIFLRFFTNVSFPAVAEAKLTKTFMIFESSWVHVSRRNLNFKAADCLTVAGKPESLLLLVWRLNCLFTI